jgi:hypothetical protein
VRIPIGTLDPVTGRSAFQLAMASRSRHRSQDMGRPELAGPRWGTLLRVLPAPGGEEASVWEGIDTVLAYPAVPGPPHPRHAPGGAGADLVSRRGGAGAAARQPRGAGRRGGRPHPGGRRALRRARGAPRVAGRRPLAPRRGGRAARRAAALAAAAGLVLDAIASDARVVPGQAFELEVQLWNGGARTVSVEALPRAPRRVDGRARRQHARAPHAGPRHAGVAPLPGARPRRRRAHGGVLPPRAARGRPVPLARGGAALRRALPAGAGGRLRRGEHPRRRPERLRAAGAPPPGDRGHLPRGGPAPGRAAARGGRGPRRLGAAGAARASALHRRGAPAPLRGAAGGGGAGGDRGDAAPGGARRVEGGARRGPAALRGPGRGARGALRRARAGGSPAGRPRGAAVFEAEDGRRFARGVQWVDYPHVRARPLLHDARAAVRRLRPARPRGAAGRLRGGGGGGGARLPRQPGHHSPPCWAGPTWPRATWTAST